MAEIFALQSLFEGLFIKALTPRGAFRDGLRQRGFDVDRPQLRYPVRVWVECVDLAATELHPRLSRAAAWEALGETFAVGYFQTLIGKMISAMLPFLSARSFVLRSPHFIATGLQNANVELTWLDDRTARLVISGPGEMAGHLMTGVFRESFRRLKVRGVKLEARVLGPLDGEIVMTLP
ncbi:MAG: DUF2378 family protein [Myxococcaceae bacterium]